MPLLGYLLKLWPCLVTETGSVFFYLRKPPQATDSSPTRSRKILAAHTYIWYSEDTMRKCTPILLLCLLNAICRADTPFTPSPTPSAPAASNEAEKLMKDCADALEQLHTALSPLRAPEDLPRALPTIRAAVQAHHSSMYSLQQLAHKPDTPEWHTQIARLRKHYRALCELGQGDDFVQLVWESEPLTYHLLLQSPYLPVFLHGETVDYILQYHSMSAHSPEPEAAPHLDRLRAQISANHITFMTAHPHLYTGGNGADEKSSIILRPLVESTAQISDEEIDEQTAALIRDYMRAVYPQASFGFGTWMAKPNGAFYSIQVLFPGLYTTAEGRTRLLKYPVWFQTRAPRENR